MLGSIFGGIATPTEAAGIGALFSLILAIFYKQFSWKMLYESLIDTAKTTAMVFIIPLRRSCLYRRVHVSGW